MMKIKAVGYLGIGAPDPREWLHYATDILGMMPARAVPGEGWGMPVPEDPGPPSGGRGIAEDGSVYLKMDERQWRIGVHPDPDHHGLRYIGLELDGPVELEDAVRELEAKGIEVRRGSDDEAYNRAVSGIAFLQDPVGNPLELFYGPTMDYSFVSPNPGQRFVAGHLGIGHLNLFVSDQPACFDFYTNVLGFRLTDYIRYGRETQLQFLHCNARHHSIAIVDMGGIDALQHLMLEVANVDDVGRILDRAQRAGIGLSSTLGRHRNDRTLSFYMPSPFGFDVEVGCEGLLLDETWTPNEFCEGDVWGHHGLVEAVMQASETLKARPPRAKRLS